MKLGLFGINVGLCARDPSVLAQLAVAAEDAGWESVWAAEHYVLPVESGPPSPAPGDTPMLDPFVALATAAAHTTTLLVGTGVIVVPLHQPLALAKRVASLDVVSGGRFLFGVGVGYLQPEFEALGVSLERRGHRLMDSLATMQTIWAKGSLDGVQAEPRPPQAPYPPLHIGGYVAASYQRAVAHGHGWYGYALDLAQIEQCVAGLQAAATEVERPDRLAPLEVSVTPHPDLRVDAETVAQLTQLGVDRLILRPQGLARDDGDRLIRFVEEEPARLSVTAPAVGPSS